MLKKSLMFGIGVLLLAGFTATVADAGETRRAGGKVVVTDEDDGVRKARRPARPTTSNSKPRATRPAPVRRPAVVPARTGRTRVVPGHLSPRPTSRVVSRRPVRPPARRWVPGHYEDRIEHVRVPGHYRTKHVPARYETRRGWFGITWRILVAPARTKRIWVPGHYREEIHRVWIPGHWIRLPHRHGGYRPHR